MIFCTVGKHYKKEDNFRKTKCYLWANGTRGFCNDCWKKRQLENWHTNKMQYAKTHKQWEKNNREHLSEYQRQRKIENNI